MAEPFLQPTVVQEIRGFLRSEGLVLRPWSGASEVLEALLGLLNRKKDDPAFWGPLQGLLSRVVARQELLETFTASYKRDAEVFGAGDLRHLVQELRDALPGKDRTQGSALMEVLRSLRAPALASALLLLVAVGCDNNSKDITGGGDVQVAEVQPGVDTEPSAGDVEPSLPDAGDVPLKDVFEYLEESDLPSWVKEDLEECLSMFSESERQDLVGIFQDKTPEEIAEYLENLADSDKCLDLIEPMDAIYKGISFPARTS